MSSNCRITWFRVSDSLEVLLPFARYEPGQRGPDKPKSKAFWPKGVGWAGIAWANPDTALVDEFEFRGDPETMRKDFKQRLQLSDYMVGRVSDDMARTVRMISRAVTVGTHRKTLGVLSIDIWDRSVGPATAEDLNRIEGFTDTIETIAELETEFQLGS